MCIPSLLLSHGLDKFLDAAATGLSGEPTPVLSSQGHPDRRLAPSDPSQVSWAISVRMEHQVGPPALCFDELCTVGKQRHLGRGFSAKLPSTI